MADTLLPTTIGSETIYVQAVPMPTFGMQETAPNWTEVLDKAGDLFGRAKATITNVTGDMVKAIENMSDDLMPDEFVLEFGISFSMEGQIFVAKGGGEASLKVTMTYRKG